MTAPAPPTTSPTTPMRTESRGRRIAIAFGALAAVIVIYVLYLIAVHLLAKSSGPLPPPDVNATNDTVVQVRVEKLDTVANRLTVNVLVIPENSMFDQRLGVLTTETAVRLYPENDLGDLDYKVGKAPAQLSTGIAAHGEPGNWPFDTYKTDTIASDVLVGSGDARQYIPARVEVTGSLDGWDVSATRMRDADTPANSNQLDDVVLTFHRAKGPLIFDVGICLVLIALPVAALWVAIPVALGRTSFLPPMTTWYGAMLFAIVPLRNILPGSPPYGSWVDQAIVLWVLIALVTAMFMFLWGWWQQRDRREPKKKT
jgi:hypothetical protein